MKSFFILPLALVAVAVLTACGPAAQASAPKDLVPANVNLIAQVQVAKLFQDDAFWSMYEQAPQGPGGAQNLDDLMEMALEETGVDFRQFTSAVVFGNVGQDEDYFGVIAQGQVNEAQIVAAIENFAEHYAHMTDFSLETMDYSGQLIYLDQEDVDTPALAFLDNDTVVLGTLPAVQDVIDVQQGNLARASGKVYDTFNDLGEPLISVVVVIPPEAREEIDRSLGGGQGFGMMPAMDALRDLDLMTVVMDRPGDDAKFVVTLDFLNAQSANRMSDTIDGFLKLAVGFYPDEGARALMDKIELSVNGTRLTLKFQAPIAEIQEVARSMEQGMGGPY